MGCTFWNSRQITALMHMVPATPWVKEIEALGVTISRKFSVAQHVNHIRVSCVRSLFALCTLPLHGLLTDAIHTVFHTPLVFKLSYASLAWRSFTSAADRDCQKLSSGDQQFSAYVWPNSNAEHHLLRSLSQTLHVLTTSLKLNNFA